MEETRVTAMLVPIISQTPSAAQASSDAQVLALWLHGKSPHTARGYRADVAVFGAFVGKPLREITLGDVQAYSDALSGLAPATRGRRLAAVKSLFSFAQRIGYIVFNVTAAVQAPAIKNVLAERILPEPDVHRLIALEPDTRNRLLLRLLYAGGLRVSELCGLRWRDVQASGDAGQVTLFGKGGKTRTVLLTAATWRELEAAHGDAGADDPVFVSQKGGPLSAVQAWRVVRAAARRAGIEGDVSPHWLRHAHASHALDRGAPIHLVQATLGHADLRTTSKYTHARPTDSSARYLGI
jgi:integrase/recombinase XerD